MTTQEAQWSAERLIQLHPRESFTFPHLPHHCRVAMLRDLLLNR